MNAPSPTPAADTLIVGAGLAGLLLGQRLQHSGRTVQLLEKSRGFGGRLATKRVGEAAFDTGAQFITARDPRFTALTSAWLAAGAVAPWPEASPDRLMGRPTMNALSRTLATGLDIGREAKVTAVRRGTDHWTIEVAEQPVRRARTLVLTAPAPQSLALLQAGGVALPAPLADELAGLHYHPCLALLLVLAGPSAVPPHGVAFQGDGPVRWIADNTRKGVAPGVPAAITVHLGRAFSAAHYHETETELLAQVQPEIESLLGSPVTHTALHRWRYSEPATVHAEPCVWLPELGLGLAGDAFGGPKVEGAALSALALAERMLASR
jgi:predicted NAD/FAD-dependent oxidoreductase